MWTVGGKLFLSGIVALLINLAFTAQPQFSVFKPNLACVEPLLVFFDDFEYQNLNDNFEFQKRFYQARRALLKDSFCSKRLEDPQSLATFMRYIWREHPQIVCTHRAAKTFLSEKQMRAACPAANSHDLVALESATQRILIMGETHVKDIVAYQQANFLMSQFPIRGVEGFSGNIESGSSRLADAILTLLVKSGVGAGSSTHASSETGYFFGFDGKSDFLMVNQKKISGANSFRTSPFTFLSKLDESSLGYPVTVALERSEYVKNRIEKECPILDRCPSYKRNQLLINLRNSDMIFTTGKLLKSLPKDADLLIIVGYRHIPDLVQRLACTHNMKPTVLSSLHLDYDLNFNPQDCARLAKK